MTMWPNSAQPRKSFPSMTAPPPQPVPSVSITIVSTSRAAPNLELGVGGRVRIVLDPDRQAEPLAHPAAEVDALVEWDVDRLQRAARLLVDRGREPEPEGRDVVGEELLDCGVEPCEQLVLRSGRSRMLPAPLDVSPVGRRPRRGSWCRRDRRR